MAELRLLGPVEVIGQDGTALHLGGPKERALLALLACHPGEVVSEDRLVDALWLEEPPRTAKRTLQSYLSRVRRSLSAANGAFTLESRPGGWSLHVTEGALDVARAEARPRAARAAARAGDFLEAALAFREALGEWRGRPLDEFADHPWAVLEAVRLREMHQWLLEDRVDADLACGRHAELVGELERMCRANPLRERLWAQLVLAYYRSGRQAEALRAFQDVRRMLAEELGIDPGPALARLEQQVLSHDPSLELTTSPPGEPSMAEPVTALGPVAAEPVTTGGAAMPLPDGLALLAAGPFVGRRGELEVLEAAVEEVGSRRCRLVFVTGEPGIGKTTLVAQTAAEARAQGASVLFGRCDEHSLIAFQPFVEAIDSYVAQAPPDELRGTLGGQAADLALLVPGLARRLPELGSVMGTGAETERYRIFEAVAAFLSSLSEARPVVLVLDDLHWADRPTLGLLQHLIRRSRDRRVLFVGTYRDTDLVRTQPLAEALVDLRRADVVSRVHLSGLSADDVLELVTRGSAPADQDREFARVLWSETEGSPLFLREILRHLEESGVVGRGEDGRYEARRRIDQLGIPEGVKEVIGRRLSRLSEEANQALRAGSVIGRELRLDVLERVSGLTQDQLLDAMDEALASGVVDEVPSALGRWSFTHAMVRYTLYEELSLSRRVRMHQRVGEALEALEEGDGPHLAELAYHFSQSAVSGTADKAITYACQAGAYALRQAAWEQAARHFAGAVEVAEDAGMDVAVVADLLLAQGEAEWRARDATVARRTFDRVIALVGSGDPLRLARAALGYAGFGVRAFWVEMFVVNDRVLELLETALAGLPEEPSALRAQVLACLAQELYFQSGTDERRRALADEALAMARAIGRPEVLAGVLSASILAILGPDSGEEVERHAAEMLAVAEELGDAELEAAALRFLWTTPTTNAERVFSALERWEALIGELKDPSAAAFDKLMRSGVAMQRGRLVESDTLVAEAFRQAHEIHDRNAFGAGALMLAWLRQFQGRSAEVLGVLDACRDVYPAGSAWGDAVVAGGYAEIGDDVLARTHLDAVDPADPASLPRNAMWLMAVGMYARACHRLGDADRAAVAYELLLPYGDVWGLVACIGQGSLHLPIAMTAWTSGRIAEARHHFQAALEMDQAWGWLAPVTEVRLHFARFLAESGDAADAARARELVTEALVAAEEIGMPAVAREARHLLSALDGEGGPVNAAIATLPTRSRPRKSGRRARLVAGGRAAVARWTAGESDEALFRRFGSSLPQRALFVAVGRAFQPGSALGFSGDLVLELRPPDDELDPAAADWWTIEVRGRKATARRGRSEHAAVTVHLRLATFIRIISGELHPVRAVIENLAEVEGDFVLAARLADMFGAIEPTDTRARAVAN